MSDRRFDDIPEDLRPAARHIAEALAADVPELVARRHERLLVEHARTLAYRPARHSTRRLLVSLVAAAVMLVATTAVAAASDGAAPGGLLYGVDRALERLELALPTSPSTAAEIHLAHAAERIEEARDVLGEHLAQVIEDALGSHEAALDAASSADQPEAEQITAHVLERIGLHVDRLLEVRERLLASGHASPAALEALARAADNARTAQEHAGPRTDRETPGERGTDQAPPVPTDRAPEPAPAPPAQRPQQAPPAPAQSQGAPEEAPGQRAPDSRAGQSSQRSGGDPSGDAAEDDERSSRQRPEWTPGD